MFFNLTRWLLGVLMVVAGLNHFVNPGFYLQIMPPYLPFHRALVLISGVMEVAAGLLLLVPATRAIGAWGLILTLVVVFPANLHMALNASGFPGIPAWLLWLRLPLQGALILWAYQYR